jgi:hypothetical protein
VENLWIIQARLACAAHRWGTPQQEEREYSVEQAAPHILSLLSQTVGSQPSDLTY